MAPWCTFVAKDTAKCKKQRFQNQIFVFIKCENMLTKLTRMKYISAAHQTNMLINRIFALYFINTAHSTFG